MPKRSRRSTIGANPLDTVVPEAPPEAAQTPRKVSKERLTVHMPTDLIDEVKDVVFWTPGLTLAGLAEEAFRVIVERMKAEHGGPFPPRKEELRGGRPLK